ncbi:MAG: ABC transporter permease subunit [Gammaproteobacteria bacterium]|nr:ABC transporter permease subunit [Gammaproteobacteria bacterium]
MSHRTQKIPFSSSATKLIRLSVILMMVGLLSGCKDVNWGWYVVSPFTNTGQTNLQFLLGGLWNTVLLSFTAIVISVFIGLVVALPSLSTNKHWRMVNRVYVEAIRAIPILVLILWVYYGLPVVAGIQINVFWAGVVALALSDSAFQAEIFRAGIQSIDKGQTEASHSINLNYPDTLRFVILPQAIRRVLPALGNQLVYMLKMSSLVSIIGMQELTRRANELVVTEYRPLEIYTVLVLEYLVLILIVSAFVRRLEKKMGANVSA